MFGFLERELRQIHLIAEAPLGPHRASEGLDVLRYRFLARNELRAQPEGEVTFDIRQLLPVRAVAGEVDVGRIPELGVASGKKLQWQAVPVQSARDHRA